MLKDRSVDSSIVSWLDHGKAFRVHKPEEFVKTVMPLYFRQSHYKSFQRQLNLWGFERVGRGPEVGAYYHKHFLKGQPSLCGFMTRQKIKGTGGTSNSNSAGVSNSLSEVQADSPMGSVSSPQVAHASRRSSSPAVPQPEYNGVAKKSATGQNDEGPFNPLAALADLALLAGKTGADCVGLQSSGRSGNHKTSGSEANSSVTKRFGLVPVMGTTQRKAEMKDASESSVRSLQAGEAGARKEPKRPMSAYNIFFEHQRKRILAGRSLKDDITSDEFVQSIEAILLASNGGAEPSIDSEEKKQPDFEDLSRQVSQMWKSIDPVNRAILDCYAAQEMRRYEAEVKTWREHKDAVPSLSAGIKSMKATPVAMPQGRGGLIGALRGHGDPSRSMFGGRVAGLSDSSLLARQFSGGASQLQSLFPRSALGVASSRRSSAPSMFALPAAASKTDSTPSQKDSRDAEAEKMLPLKKRRSLSAGGSDSESVTRESEENAAPKEAPQGSSGGADSGETGRQNNGYKGQISDEAKDSLDCRMEDIEEARRKVAELVESISSKNIPMDIAALAQTEQLLASSQAAGRPILDFLRGGALLDRGSSLGDLSMTGTEMSIVDLLRGGALPGSSLLPSTSSDISRLALRQALLRSQLPFSLSSAGLLPSLSSRLLESSLALSQQGGMHANLALPGNFGAGSLPMEGLGFLQDCAPKRPLSSFDIFYEIERHRILSGCTSKLTKEELALNIDEVFSRPSPISHLSSSKNDEISLLIGELWNTADPEIKAILENCAIRDLARYKSELNIWAATQGINISATEEGAGNSDEREVSSAQERIAQISGSTTNAPVHKIHPPKVGSGGSNSKEPSFSTSGGDTKNEKHSLPFPFALHNMLHVAEEEGKTSVVSWLPHGKGFRVNNKEVFVATMMTSHFKQTKFKSFQRQLNLWGFTRVTEGADTGAYFHRYFVRGEPALCKMMTRQKIKGASASAVAASQEKMVEIPSRASPSPGEPQSPVQEAEKESATSRAKPASFVGCPLTALASCATDKVSMPSIVRTAAASLKLPDIANVTNVAAQLGSSGDAATRDRAIHLSNLALEVVGE